MFKHTVGTSDWLKEVEPQKAEIIGEIVLKILDTQEAKVFEIMHKIPLMELEYDLLGAVHCAIYELNNAVTELERIRTLLIINTDTNIHIEGRARIAEGTKR